MRPIPLQGATRVMKAPVDWNEKSMGVCSDLEICDTSYQGRSVMISAWRPTDEELKDLLEGKPLMLVIHGIDHPVVSLFTGEMVEG